MLRALTLILLSLLVIGCNSSIQNSNSANRVATNTYGNANSIAQNVSSSSNPTNPNYLSEETMRRMILRRGAWNFGFGWVPMQRVEILKVGDFNPQGKYWPVRVRSYDEKNRNWVLDYQIFKNDYGEWDVRMIGSI
jgi:hypothetical protein